MEDFFSRFSRPLVSIRRDNAKNEEDENFVILDYDVTNSRFYVRIQDKNGNPLHLRRKDFSGAFSDFIGIYNELSDDGFNTISWQQTLARGVSVTDNPLMMRLLWGCDFLYDDKFNKISFAENERKVVYNVTKLTKDDELGSKCLGSLSIKNDEDGSNIPVKLVTDSIAYDLANHTIYEIRSVGPNFGNINPFLDTIGENEIPMMLSLFLSYFNNIDIRVQDMEFHMTEEQEAYVPTLVIEKIDPANSLYLRLIQTCNKVPEAGARLGLTCFVERDGDQLIGHTLIPVDMDEARADLSSHIDRAAPSKSDKKEIYCANDFYILPEATASNFLFIHLPALLNEFRIMGVDKLKDYNVKPVMPKLNARLSSGIDFLQGSIDVDIEGETLSLGDLIKQYTKNHYIQLADGSRAVIDPDYMKRLERIYKHNRGKKGEFKISFFDLPEIDDLLEQKVKGKGLNACRAIYAGFSELSRKRLRLNGLNATLRPYQKEGVKWIDYLYRNNLGGCLADDMGLGKTIQTIAMLLKIFPEETKPALIVMPRSLIFNWERELDRFAPSLSHSTYYGQDRNLKEALKSQVILTSYAIVRNDIEQLSKLEFSYVVLDESQSIKNTGAQVTRAIWLLNGHHRLAISGTPIENNLTELYSLFRFLNPPMFGSLEDFNSNYTYPIQKDNDKVAANELRRKIYPFILRRLKRDVLEDLPDLIHQDMEVDMEPEQAALYESRRAKYYEEIHGEIARHGIAKSQFMMLQALSELRRIASVPENLSDGTVKSSKMQLLIEKLENLTANGHKTVVFFNFVAGIGLAGQELERLGIKYETMTGSTSNRQQVVDSFQNNPDCKVLLMTLKTGGVGLNLTAADTVIIFEPWWNAAAQEQGINRLHRIGQKSKVMSIALYTSGTIEDKIHELQQKKSMLVDDIITPDSGAFKQLTEEDIDFILSR